MRDIAVHLDRWRANGVAAVTATVVETRRSAPRPPGAKMAVGADGSVHGTVSGGCVEGAVVAAAEEVLAGGAPRLLLAEGPSTPRELGDALGLSQQNVSKHLLTLHRVGVVSRRPEGVNVIYELSGRRALDMLRLALKSVTAQLQELSELAMGASVPPASRSSERPSEQQ